MSDYEDDEDDLELGRLPGGGRSAPRVQSRASGEQGISVSADRIERVTVQYGSPAGPPEPLPPTQPHWLTPRRLAAVAAGVVALALVIALVVQEAGSGGGSHPGPGPLPPVSTTPAPTGSASPSPSTPPATPTSSAPAPPPPSPSPDTPSPSPSATVIPVRWQGTVTLVDGNNGPGQFYWDMDVYPPSPGLPSDLSLDCNLVCTSGRIDGHAVVPWKQSAAPTRDQCANLLNSELGQSSVDVKPGSMACFGTNQGRVGYFVTQDPPDQDSQLLAVVLWEHR
ncbi:hypothetical protein [Kitasatospora viridis]|nr:hypothetical protein [Kitasatospora viridis]